MGYHVRVTGPARCRRGPRVAVGGPTALPLTFVPDKRQESKQRRAARNRANREALAARRENAVVSAPTAKASGAEPGAKATKAGATRGRAGRGTSGTTADAATSSAAPAASGKRPGELFLWIAFGLAIAGTAAMLFLIKAPVDDRGEPIPGGPNAFGGLTIAAREAVTGEPLPDESVSYLDAYGTSAVLSAALPLTLTAFALWASRRRVDRSRMLTYAMLGMAVAIFIGGGGIVFFPALIFLAIGGFIARRADLPARVAERATGTGGGLFGRRGPVIDAESEEVVDDDEAEHDDTTGTGRNGRPTRTAPSRARRTRRRGAAEVEADEAVTADADVIDADEVDTANGAGGAATSGAPGGGDRTTTSGAPADADADADDAVADADEVDPLAELEAELEAERAAEAAARAERVDDQSDDDGTRRKR